MIRALKLPLPPSTNHLYPSLPNGKRVKSREARAYEQEVALAIREQWGVIRWQGHGQWEPYVGAVCTGWIYVVDYRRRDIDNGYKIVLDSCKAVGVYDDDSQVDALKTRKYRRRGGEKYLLFLLGAMEEEDAIDAAVKSGALSLPPILAA